MNKIYLLALSAVCVTLLLIWLGLGVRDMSVKPGMPFTTGIGHSDSHTVHIKSQSASTDRHAVTGSPSAAATPATVGTTLYNTKSDPDVHPIDPDSDPANQTGGGGR